MKDLKSGKYKSLKTAIRTTVPKVKQPKAQQNKHKTE